MTWDSLLVATVALMMSHGAVAAQESQETRLRYVAVDRVVTVIREDWGLTGPIKLSPELFSRDKENLGSSEMLALLEGLGLIAGDFDDDAVCAAEDKPASCYISGGIAIIQVGVPSVTSDTTAVVPIRARFQVETRAGSDRPTVYRREWIAEIVFRQGDWVVRDLVVTLTT